METLDTHDLAQALPNPEHISTEPSMADLARALGEMQVELQTLREENITLKQEIQRYKPKSSPWGGAISKDKRPILQPPKFGDTFVNTTQTSSPSLTSPINVTVTTPTPVPLAPPERFYGECAKYDIFMNQCQLQILCRPTAFTNDAAKVAFIILYLGGTAANWSIPLVEGNDPLLYNYTLFKETMRKLFSRHMFVQASDNELLNLKQGGKDLLSYITTFNRLIAETQWPEAKRASLFYRGLRDELKDSLSHIVDLPVECSELIDLVVKLDHRLNERKGDRIRSEHRFVYISKPKREGEAKVSDPEPMQIGGVRGPLTPEEKERRRKLLLCLYCGKAGHFARECTVRPKVSRKTANTVGITPQVSEN